VDSARDYWDGQAAAFDDEPDHGLRDPEVRRAWRMLLAQNLPPAPARIADLGCGTGTLSILLAEQGHLVRGVDLSREMVARARLKAAQNAGLEASFTQGDAADPPLEPAGFDVVLSRHVLWALPDPSAALERWISLLTPDGRLVLVEGYWFTGAGLTAKRCESLVLEHRQDAVVRPLDDAVYWGGPIDDERYILVSRR
jgi:SAM-dependent methyltransferase